MPLPNPCSPSPSTSHGPAAGAIATPPVGALLSLPLAAAAGGALARRPCCAAVPASGTNPLAVPAFPRPAPPRPRTTASRRRPCCAAAPALSARASVVVSTAAFLEPVWFLRTMAAGLEEYLHMQLLFGNPTLLKCNCWNKFRSLHNLAEVCRWPT